ncbi:MAG TPA: GNAT family N-acetyltransferase [Gemmatimonadales bacterium]|nr:GNAT family N-acetyltransferase [Gemmatimonadales bacterium]
MKIRPASAADAPALSRLFVQLGYPKGADAELIPARLAKIESLGDTCLVAEADDGRVVGLAGLHLVHVLHYPKPLGYITAFVVDDTVRRQGVGRKLLDAATEWARAKGCYRLSLTSAEHRQDAHAFYPASGFPMTGRRFGKEL